MHWKKPKITIETRRSWNVLNIYILYLINSILYSSCFSRCPSVRSSCSRSTNNTCDWWSERVSEWLAGQVSEWVNEWTDGWTDGLAGWGIGWSEQLVWGNGNQCNVYADAGARDPKDLGTEDTETQIQDHKLLSIMLHATVLPFLCLIVDVSPLASFYPPPLTSQPVPSLPSLTSGPCFVFCADDLRVPLIKLPLVYLSCDCGNCTLDSTYIVPIIAVRWHWECSQVT